MTRMIPRTMSTLVAICVVIGSVASRAPVSAQQPVFRSGVDVVQLDVLVLDADRLPVRGLTSRDFTVVENGETQKILDVNEVVLPRASTAKASWTREATRDVVSNDLLDRRLIALVIDDAATGVAFGESKAVRDVLNAVINELGPADMASVAYTFLGRAEPFTVDRSKLRKAVSSFLPHNVGPMGQPLACKGRVGGCLISLLTNIANVLKDAPAGRKMIIVLSPTMTLAGQKEVLNESLTGSDGVNALMQLLRVSNTSIYQIDPRGLQVERSLDVEVDLAEATGGRAIRNTNAPERLVPGIFEESSSYYLISYESTHTARDGRLRRTDVSVNRPGVTVRNRRGYFGTARNAAARNLPATASPLESAMFSGLPGIGMPLRVTVSAFAVPGRKTADVVAVLGLPEPDRLGEMHLGEPLAQRVNVVTAAWDTGWRSKGAFEQTVEVVPVYEAKSHAWYEVTSRLPLQPGRYELRFGGETKGTTGSVFVTLDIPNFAKDALSLSGLLMEKQRGVRTSAGQSLRDLIPIVPTTSRQFARAEQVRAFVRVYQGGSAKLQPVTMATQIRDTDDRIVLDRTAILATDVFARDRAADVFITIPTEDLRPGDYLLTTVATMQKRKIERASRFSVVATP